MSAILILILASLAMALLFLGSFIWAVRAGQFDDTVTPSLRVLTEEAGPASANSSNAASSVAAGVPPAVEGGHPAARTARCVVARRAGIPDRSDNEVAYSAGRDAPALLQAETPAATAGVRAPLPQSDSIAIPEDPGQKPTA